MPDVPSAAAAPRGLKQAGIVAALVAAGVVAAGAFTRSHDVDAATRISDAQSIPTVHLIAAKGGAASSALELPGTMQAWNAAKLYARVSGYVRGWSKDIGATVGAGTPLGTIDTPELDQQIVEARAALASARAHAGLARSTAVRWNDLLTTASVSKQEADEKNGDLAVKVAAVREAQAALGRLEAMKSFAVVRAPFAGVVTARNADIGDLVGPGSGGTQQPMFAVADTRRIRVYISVPQSYSAAVKPGMAAALSVPAFPGRSFPAHVTGMSGAVDAQTGAFQVELQADNPGDLLKPGGFAQVSFDLPGQAGGVEVPSSVLLFRSAGSEVATVDPNGRIRLRRVQIGLDKGQTVQILSGLRAGERIVDNPPDSLAEGELVRVGVARG
ncbi:MULTISPECIES: efflux RND transporter periplasmic adaptor subunit [unclassified Sphingomonas]|uniref:efflux RND transporter periplasmic adaptor subunit n=1 Tax=unclassified Sphingomonas TaxID=196159 RepID=UPI0009298CB5|nr:MULTISPECIES: efflux RND transporter periplasmic adaptor subunit [unclassified Sphingomonas]MBN8846961.1 efflux RND transporter periplasmic adaptor subunit [Sphingomonas sp.]OJV27406.1 MAG: efflux transporter periplasmic adaptor subunit [Sphingomonas sp. 67-36]